MYGMEENALATPINSTSAIAKTSDSVGAALATRQAQEVQGAVLMAKRFPRDLVEVEKKLIQSCKRPRLAEIATYSYPRGGKDVTGPSIRIAEAAAQAMGNIDFGWTEIQRLDDSSICYAYAWDIENNIRRSATFTVPHYRDTKQGKKRLSEDRDIYEMCANQAGRRLRSCLLNVVPGDLIDLALAECERTINANLCSIQEQSEKWGKALQSEFGITPKMVVKFIGNANVNLWTADDIHRLRKLYNALKEGTASVDEVFPELAAKVISKEQLGELMQLATPVKDEAQKLISEFGYEKFKDIKTDDFDTIKAAIVKMAGGTAGA